MKSHQSSSYLRRMLFALAIVLAGLATNAHAQSLTEVSNALHDLYPTLTLTASTASAGQLEAAIELIAAPATMTVIGPAPHNATGGHIGLALPQNASGDIHLIFGALAPQTASTLAGNLITGFYKATNATPSVLDQYLPAVTAAAANFTNFATEGAADTAEASLVGQAIGTTTGAPTQLGPVLLAVLAVSDPTPLQQATLIAAKATSANLTAAGITLGQFATSLAATTDISNGVLTSSTTGAFLESIVAKETAAANQQAFLTGYTANATPSALQITASNIIAAAPPALSAASRVSIFVGLVNSGTTSGNSLTAVIPGVTVGVLGGETTTAGTSVANDTARNGLVTGATGFISFYPSMAYLIAANGATTLSDPINDSFSYAAAVVGNTNVKNGTGSNTLINVAQAMADEFRLGDVTSANGAIQTKESITEAAIKALSASQISGSAPQIIAQVANQVLSSGSTAAQLITFGTNFITAVDTKNSNWAAINAADRAYAGIGLAEDFDTHSITGGSVAVAAAAVAAYNTTIADLNGVAQPILEYFSANNSAAETEAIAAGISKAGAPSYPLGSGTVSGAAYVSAQLILAAKLTATVQNFVLADEIALGVTTDSANDTAFTTKDGFLTAMTGYLGSVTALPYLRSVLPYLATQASFNSVEIAGDVSASAAAAESGTLAAILTGSNQAQATAIAYAAAAGSGVTTDAARYVIAEDVVKNSGVNAGADDIAISGSVGTLITASVADKGTFAEDMVKLDTNVTDEAQIVLGVTNGVSATDGALVADLTTIIKTALSGYSATASAPNAKNAVNISNLTATVAFGFNGGLVGAPGNIGGAAGVASLGASVLAAESAVTGLTNVLASTLVAGTITNLGSDSKTYAVNNVGVFANALPKAVVAITNAATSGTLYTLAPVESGSIGAAIALGLPGTTTSLPAVSGSVALLVARAANISGATTVNDAIYTVAGVFASTTINGSSIPAANYQGIATVLTGTGVIGTPAVAMAHSAAPAFIAQFENSGLVGAGAPAALTTFLTALTGENYTSAADILGVTLYEEAALGITVSTVAATLESAVEAGVTAPDLTALIALGGPFAGKTATTAKTELTTILDNVVNNYAGLNSLYQAFEAVATDPEETPVVNM